MSTPHNSAQLGDFAKTCLMPGDPLRAKFIAENYLENPRLVNNVRGAQGYTGLYKNVPVSVMASGMGMPSMGIHSYELFAYYGVENILRIGSAGAISQNLQLHDIVAGMGACTNSNYMQQFSLPGSYAPICSYDLLTQAVQAADAIGVDLKVGNLLSSDTFYDVSESTLRWGKLGVLAVEMEDLLDHRPRDHGRKPALRRTAQGSQQDDPHRPGRGLRHRLSPLLQSKRLR